jgi:MOSC domain-containing protein YiiM
MAHLNGVVTSVNLNARHSFSKTSQISVTLQKGLGVLGDAHMGATVKHRSRVAKDPTQPNLRQVHLIHEELHAELSAAGFRIGPGDMGENVTTRGIELLNLPRATRLHIGPSTVVEITGLRNPCVQLDTFQPGLMAAVLDRSDDGQLVRKAGVMGIVLASGDVQPGDEIRVELPPMPHEPLDCV